MKLGELLYPYKRFQSGGPVSPSRFDEISGLSGDALASYLGSTFGLQDAGQYTQYFDPYSTVGEEQLKRQHALGVESAKAGARGQLSDLYSKARAAGARGGGFGGRSKAVEQAKGKTLGALQQQKAKLGETLEQGIYGEREKYVQDFLNQVGRLGQMGATFGETTNSSSEGYDTTIYGAGFDESTGSCAPGYYMAGPDSDQQGCIPMSGTTDEGNTYGGNESSPQQECAAKGGIWFEGQCDFPGGGSGGEGGIDDTMP